MRQAAWSRSAESRNAFALSKASVEKPCAFKPRWIAVSTLASSSTMMIFSSWAACRKTLPQRCRCGERYLWEAPDYKRKSAAVLSISGQSSAVVRHCLGGRRGASRRPVRRCEKRPGQEVGMNKTKKAALGINRRGGGYAAERRSSTQPRHHWVHSLHHAGLVPRKLGTGSGDCCYGIEFGAASRRSLALGPGSHSAFAACARESSGESCAQASTALSRKPVTQPPGPAFGRPERINSAKWTAIRDPA